MILAIDPGSIESGWVCFEHGRVLKSGKSANAAIVKMLESIQPPNVAIEMVQSFGMAVGETVFETVRWIGIFQQATGHRDRVRLIYRKEVKMALCHATVGVTDSHIRRRLMDILGEPGTKKNPGPTYGLKGDAWSALAVAVVALAKSGSAEHP